MTLLSSVMVVDRDKEWVAVVAQPVAATTASLSMARGGGRGATVCWRSDVNEILLSRRRGLSDDEPH
jgi:hypothetical protein